MRKVKPRLILPDGAYFGENGCIIMPEGSDWTQEPYYVEEEVEAA